ncbi:MAG: MotA/TolQ/ExbB proton channel family protein [Simkaniaceae bacterium]|nr:MotA/TolQ/ExbB proton channel family protein [Simkaniaceae bacterium]
MTAVSMTTFVHAYFQADFFGKLIFLGLFASSIVCWFFLLHKLWLYKQVRYYSKAFKSSILQHKDSILGISLEHLPKVQNKDIPHPFAHIFLTLKQKTVELLDKNHFHLDKPNYVENPGKEQVFLSTADIELLESHVHATTLMQKEALQKNLFLFPMIVTLAPFLGLLGTVWGILITFAGMQTNNLLSSNTAMLGGLSTALTTTVLGLLIAIPALVGYNFLKNITKSLNAEIYEFSHFLLSTIELQYRKVDVS